MFPLSDDNSDRLTTPWVNYALIAANVFVFLALQAAGSDDAFTNAFSCVPREIVTGQDLVGKISIDSGSGQHLGDINHYQTPVSVYLTLFSSMFLHGGFAHLGGNMLYLWIFGDNLEDLMGHLKFMFFYLICGVFASLAHVFCTLSMHGNDLIPSLGASGAISGVLGAYILLFPQRRVTVIFMRQLMHVPAYVCLGIWIVFQLLESSGLLGGSSDGAGVAYAAHIGGFVAGVVLVKLFVKDKNRPMRF